MANLTKQELRDRVLEHLGVKAAGQTASAEDAALVEEAIDQAFGELAKPGLVPFATSAIPDWAVAGLRDYVEPEVKPAFGFPMTNAQKEQEQIIAKRKLERQMPVSQVGRVVKVEYF